ncbi:DDE-type integrase/transposase/recombinase [Mesorhizobium sp. AR07]|uniref:DDE-type integrase/transposase/recombinase n=1 Tax=Mesorhizobium sp. AR07 TaxID=2865838 RepID=UPI0021601755|nr:DDE-type integrase/transposase/recombinase [Mesorhizobium sp. AR07]UVK45342.1 DDE-type integrase/transposase/recombinase [Mesorhizobium sp. AR07]
MKEWLTAREIAAEALPDLPTSKRGVNELIDREGWSQSALCRKRMGQDGGGGLEYHFELFPVLAQVAYSQKYMVVEPAPVMAPPDPDNTVSARAQEERDARLAIVAAFEKFSHGLQLGYATRVQVFCDRYNVGMIEVSKFVRETMPAISKRSLARWQATKRAGKANSLGHDPAKSRKGTGALETANGGAVKAYILGLIAHRSHLCADDVRVQCRAEFGDVLTVVSKGVETVIPMPPVRTFQHALKHLKVRYKVELLKLTNPDLYRSTMAPAGVGMLRHITEPNQMWQIDASPVDALCVDGRHSIYACIDIATRRMIFHVSRTPRASAVALLLRKAIIAWGVPDLVKTDNGSDFVARETERLFASLGIEVRRSRAYSPQEKGHIERGIGTFQRKVGPHLPGFIGHDVTDRKAIESKKAYAQRLGESDADTFGVTLTARELQDKVDEWADIKYQNTPHEGLDRRTPFQAALASTRTIRKVDERALDLLLMPVAGGGGRRIVQKQGIEINRYHYMPERIMPGTEVLVRMNTEDLGRVHAFTLDGGEYLGDAICPELSGLNPQQVAAQRKAAAKAFHEESTAPIRAKMRQIDRGGPAIDRLLEVARREVPNVIALPKREEVHETPQIVAAITAMESRTRPPETKLSGRAAEIHAELQVQQIAAPPGVTMLRTEETPQQRFRRALDMRSRLEAGERLSDQELLWLGGYEAGPEFKGLKAMYDDFGGVMSM